MDQKIDLIKIWPDDILKVVSNYYDLPLDILRSKSRNPKYIKAVHIIWYLCSEHTKWYYGDLARMMNRKSHCDITHAKKSVKDQMETNKLYRQEVSAIENRLFKITEVRNFMHYVVMKTTTEGMLTQGIPSQP